MLFHPSDSESKVTNSFPLEFESLFIMGEEEHFQGKKYSFNRVILSIIPFLLYRRFLIISQQR